MVTKGQMIYLLSNSVNQFFKEVRQIKVIHDGQLHINQTIKLIKTKLLTVNPK